MRARALGLTALSTADLRKLLRALHREDLRCPLTIEGLTRVGLQHAATDLLDHLRNLDGVAVQAVLVAVLAERIDAQRPSPNTR